MSWMSRLKSFKAYCEQNGYELLADDYKFLYDGMFSLPKNDSRRVLGRYLAEWCSGMGRAKKPSERQGFGRRAANTWYREYLDHYKDRNAG